ncbi:MAG: ATP-sensitive inward rectifier potassium channel 10 [Myxococcales bacterium]|nr:MAG: ATP-sensitive inward rectifier potassium channel 10 [Myxococcales bacterium]
MAKSAFRSIDRSGRVVVRRVGTSRRPLRDLYLRLLRLKWRWLITGLVSFHLLANSVFASLYLLREASIVGAREGSFTDAFFFSVQTMSTIGYGSMAPASLYAHILVTVQAFIGMLSVALVTGLTFAKFSHPSARVAFSRNAIVATRNAQRVLMFRMANERNSYIVEAKLRMTLLRDEVSQEGELLRRFYDMPLVREWTPVFALSWTAIHVIDEQSPLYELLDSEALEEAQIEIIASLSGIDESYNQPVHVRNSYAPSDILFGGRFKDMIERDGQIRRINFAVLHDVEP